MSQNENGKYFNSDNYKNIFELAQDPISLIKLFRLLETSATELDEAITTLNHLLDIDFESQNLNRNNIQLFQAVKKNVDILQLQLRDVRLEVEVSEDLTVMVVAHFLDYILNNLLTNAIKYKREDTKPLIKIKAYKEQQSIILSVEDNGIGIDLRKSYHKLFKYKSRLNAKLEGKGIGLYLSKYKAEVMGGKITVESTVDVGSTFKLHFI